MKTVIVTGVSRGLGLVFANKFKTANYQVIGTGRSSRPDALDPAVLYSQFDASNYDACESFWESLPAENLKGTISLINNAGGYIGGGLTESSAEDYQKMMQSNYFSAVYMTQSLVKILPKARVINIISASALSPGPSDEAYGSSKAASMHFFKSLQKELKPDKYQITNIYPNSIATQQSNTASIEPVDLADFVLDLTHSELSYYIADVTLIAR